LFYEMNACEGSTYDPVVADKLYKCPTEDANSKICTVFKTVRGSLCFLVDNMKVGYKHGSTLFIHGDPFGANARQKFEYCDKNKSHKLKIGSAGAHQNTGLFSLPKSVVNVEWDKIKNENTELIDLFKGQQSALTWNNGDPNQEYFANVDDWLEKVNIIANKSIKEASTTKVTTYPTVEEVFGGGLTKVSLEDFDVSLFEYFRPGTWIGVWRGPYSRFGHTMPVDPRTVSNVPLDPEAYYTYLQTEEYGKSASSLEDITKNMEEVGKRLKTSNVNHIAFAHHPVGSFPSLTEGKKGGPLENVKLTCWDISVQGTPDDLRNKDDIYSVRFLLDGSIEGNAWWNWPEQNCNDVGKVSKMGFGKKIDSNSCSFTANLQNALVPYGGLEKCKHEDGSEGDIFRPTQKIKHEGGNKVTHLCREKFNIWAWVEEA